MDDIWTDDTQESGSEREGGSLLSDEDDRGSSEPEAAAVIKSKKRKGDLTERKKRGLFTWFPTPGPKAEGRGDSYGHQNYKVYRWRWFMLVTMFILNVSNGTMWLSFAPIPDYTSAFFGVKLEQVDWFSISFFVVSLLVGFLGIVILDKFGLRISLYLGAAFNMFGSILRWLSTWRFIVCSDVFDQSGFMVALIGQILTACAQPFILYSPTKLAAFWFGPKERAFCTMLASLGNPIGIALAQLISPNIVTETSRLRILMAVYSAPAVVTALLVAVAFWPDKPPVPPAPSADKINISFLQGLGKVLTNISFWVLLVVWGCGAGIFNALVTLLAQMLCPFGYSDKDSGLWGSLMIFCGLVGATIAGLLIDYTKRFKEITIVTLSLAILCLILFTEVSSLHKQPILIAFSLCLFGFFALPLIPACMELGVEVTYPVAEATSSGLLWSAVQVMGIVLVLLGQGLQFNLPPDLLSESVCAVGSTNSSQLPCLLENNPDLRNSTNLDLSAEIPKDFTHALLLYDGLAVAVLFLLVVAFRPKFKRLEMERRATLLAKLQHESSTPNTSLPSTHGERIAAKGTGPSQNRLSSASTKL